MAKLFALDKATGQTFTTSILTVLLPTAPMPADMVNCWIRKKEPFFQVPFSYRLKPTSWSFRRLPTHFLTKHSGHSQYCIVVRLHPLQRCSAEQPSWHDPNVRASPKITPTH